MEWLYAFFSFLGIENIGLCIIIFTLIIKLLMFPLTMKQQIFSKVSSAMNPELQAIQKKYQGKRDNESMAQMQKETQAVYKKYGTSPTGSCLQLLIQMPILFSLYYIVSNVPSYVPQVEDYYKDVSEAVVADYDYFKYMDKAYDEYIVGEGEDKYKYVDDMLSSFNSVKSSKKVIDSLVKYETSAWDNLEKSYETIGDFVKELSKIEDKQWDEMLEKIDDEDTKAKIEKLVDDVKDGKLDEIKLVGDVDVIKDSEDNIMEINEFGPINLSQSPSSTMGIAIIIPILSFLTQWGTAKLTMSANSAQMEDNPMGNSMKVMNVVLPLFSAFIAFTVPAGLGLYWCCNGIFTMIQQIALNMYFKDKDIKDIVKKNVEKMNARNEKYGIDVNGGSTKANNTKSISSKANINTKSISAGEHSYKKGSMAEKANMVKIYNEKNNRK